MGHTRIVPREEKMLTSLKLTFFLISSFVALSAAIPYWGGGHEAGCWFAHYRQGGCREYDKVKIPGGKMHVASLKECDKRCREIGDDCNGYVATKDHKTCWLVKLGCWKAGGNREKYDPYKMVCH